MTDTIENKIYNRMKKAKRGVVFFTENFATYGNAKSCSKALQRLVEQEKILRAGRGIYALPQKSEYFGLVGPGFDEIARGIARRDKARIVPTGLFAENILGLSTQVPMKTVYLTDGTPRKLKIGNSTIIFKKTAPKNVATQGKLSTLAIQALKSIGKKRITEAEIEKVVNILKEKENQKHLAHDIKLAPEWIRVILKKALTD
jgi:hypothetical protein